MKNFVLPALLWSLALVPALAQTTDAQVRPVAPFHAIKVGTGIALDLTAGHGQRVEASAATTEMRDRIKTTVEDGVLVIRYENPDSDTRRNTSTQHLRVAVTADQLTALTAGSGAAVDAKGDYAAPNFQLDVSSGASLRADIATTDLTVRQGSGSVITLKGKAPHLDIRTGSGSVFNGKDLQTDKCEAQASSGSTLKIAVREALVAEASSGASIKYQGAPTVTKHTGSGGSVRSM
ncbi:head GIN domain-containing protein [Hymenobacter sp. PAMC 26628]|uniref:head GIN domain-containing protein n=1 Tax=Hymenobacter sp. PAMC 26628 TaxID=1484118 RepID=UPI0007701E04|nr:head GIN domain-containing protein [Hymenobacter sp. PAMC 26628]AMJ67282.1 hypothetical protein AXW84_19030 [Hymenobacter sp. PAMC 26628]